MKKTMVMLLLAVAAFGQEQQRPIQDLGRRLTNQDVIEMVSLGLSNGVIIDKIHASDATAFDTSVPALKALKAAKVSDAVIQAMINPHPEASVVSSVGPQSSAPASNGRPGEVGVYIVSKGKLTEMEPEIVNWQSGGFVKTHATLWIVKGDINGRVPKPKSVTQVPSPVELLIKTPEGSSVTEYQLLRLHKKGDRREFRAVTGGGVTLTAVLQGGPADRAGIRAGDVILAIDDHYLFTVEELNSEIHGHKPGATIAVRYRRRSTIYDVKLVLGIGG